MPLVTILKAYLGTAQVARTLLVAEGLGVGREESSRDNVPCVWGSVQVGAGSLSPSAQERTMTCDLGRADKNPSITCSCLSLRKASLQVLGGLWEQERRPSLTTCVRPLEGIRGVGEGLGLDRPSVIPTKANGGLGRGVPA